MMETGRVSLSFVVFATLVACRQPAPRPSNTSPALGSERSALTRIAFGSCANQDKPQPIWETIARAEPDLFLFIGDNVYGDATSADPSMP